MLRSVTVISPIDVADYYAEDLNVINQVYRIMG